MCTSSFLLLCRIKVYTVSMCKTKLFPPVLTFASVYTFPHKKKQAAKFRLHSSFVECTQDQGASIRSQSGVSGEGHAPWCSLPSCSVFQSWSPFCLSCVLHGMPVGTHVGNRSVFLSTLFSSSWQVWAWKEPLICSPGDSVPAALPPPALLPCRECPQDMTLRY